MNNYDNINQVMQTVEGKNKKNWRKSRQLLQENKQKDDNAPSNKSSINISINEMNHLNQAMMLEANSKRELI